MVLRRRRERKEGSSVERGRIVIASEVPPIPFFDRSRGMYE